VFEEFSRYVPKDGGMGTDLTPGPALAAAGFSDITGGHLHVDLPLRSPESLWRWYLTHGSRKFIEDLPADRRAEFRDRILADATAREPLILRRAAEFWTARS